MAAIALSMMVMILASSIVRGFKNTISEKVFGFWGHIHISGFYGASHLAFDPRPISKRQTFYPHLDTVGQIATPKTSFLRGDYEGQTEGGVRHIQVFASKEGIIKTADQIEGIILRGISTDYDWRFLRQYMVSGDTLITSHDTTASNGILISETTANRLKLKLNDKFDVYFVHQGDALARRFTITGIYKTGLEEYDRRFALVDIRQIQQLNNWRPYHNFDAALELPHDGVVLVGLTKETAPPAFNNILLAGNAPDWTAAQAVISTQLAASRGWNLGDSIRLHYFSSDNDISGTGDSATLIFSVVGIHDAQNRSPNNDTNWQNAIFIGHSQIQRLNMLLPEQVSGFEIFLDNIADLDAFGVHIENEVLLGQPFYSNTLKQLEPTIFDWLNLTDVNERIILIIMILVAIINMTTSLLILILERSNMIGTLKALGAGNWLIRKIFLYYAAYIIGWGLFWGNLLGIGFGLAQQYFGIIRLPEDLYYVSVAPIELNWLIILALNIGTLLITLLVLILPSYLVSRIDPIKAIRFK